MRSLVSRAGVVSALLLVTYPIMTFAQVAPVDSIPRGRPLAGPVITVSGDSVERLRGAQLAGTSRGEGLLLRSTSSLTGGTAESRVNGYQILLPRITSTTNSDLPF